MKQQTIEKIQVRKKVNRAKKERKDLEAIAENARREKAEKMLFDGKVTRIVQEVETYEVESETKKDTKYLVKCTNIHSYCCDCPDYARQIIINKNHRCKHILLVRLAEEHSLIKKTLPEDEYDF